MYLFWSDVNLALRTVRVTAKPDLGFYPKRWDEREVPAPAELVEQLGTHTRSPNCQFVFPSPTGDREQHMLDRAKAKCCKRKMGAERTVYSFRLHRTAIGVCRSS